MVPPKSQGNLPRLERLDDQLRMLGTGGSNLLQILRVRVPFFLLLGNGDRDIAPVLNLVPKLFEPRFKSGDAHRRRPHVDAATRLAKVQRDPNHPNFLGSDVGGRCDRHREIL